MGGSGHLVVDVLLGDRRWAGLLQPAARGRGGRRIALLLLHVLHILLVLLLVGLLLLAVIVHLSGQNPSPEPAILVKEVPSIHLLQFSRPQKAAKWRIA